MLWVPTVERCICEERERLLLACKIATRELADAMNGFGETFVLMERGGQSPPISGSTDDARLKSEEARLTFELHIAGHGC
jgi:hypothetical protein